jgi:hypothetical protein
MPAKNQRTKQVRRSLTVSALNVFIQHYFSLSWLREYLTKVRVTTFVYADDSEEPSYEDHPLHTLPAADRQQMVYDFMFLVHFSYEGNITATLLHEMIAYMETFEGSQKRSPGTASQSIYFYSAITSKANLSKGLLSKLWRDVLRVPFQAQCDHSFYREAKAEEFQLLGYGSEIESLFANDMPSTVHQDTLKGWMNMDCKLRQTIEKQRSMKDLISYYSNLLIIAKKENKIELSNSWETVIWREQIGGCANQNVLIAFSLQRAGMVDNHSVVRLLWEFTANLAKKNQVDDLSLLPDVKSAAQIAFGVEKHLKQLTTSEKELKKISSKGKEVIHFREILQDIPTVLRSRFLTAVAHMLNDYADDLYFELNLVDLWTSLDTFTSVTTQFRLVWKTNEKMLEKAVKKHKELTEYYHGFPDLLELVEHIFTEYCEILWEDLKRIKQYIRSSTTFHHPNWKWNSEHYYQRLVQFPFEAELLYHSMKSIENFSSSNLFHDCSTLAKNMLLQIQTWLFDNPEAFSSFNKQNERFDLLLFAVSLLQLPDISELKKALTVEYLKGCFALIRTQVKLQNEKEDLEDAFSLDLKDTAFLRVQEWISSSALDDSNNSLKVHNWQKAFSLLQILPSINNQYFADFLIWLINHLLDEGTASVDPLLFETMPLIEANDGGPAYLSLLKYYLPQHCLRIDQAIQQMVELPYGAVEQLMKVPYGRSYWRFVKIFFPISLFRKMK